MADVRCDGDPRFGQLVDEQAALRRVATLVARGVSSAELFEAVSVEVARLFGSEAGVGRFEPDGSGLILVGLSEGIRGLAVGSRLELESFLASAAVRRTGRAARSSSSRWRTASGRIADALGESGLVSSISAPITVDGKPWGVIGIAETRRSLPPDTEERLEKFTELVATAIANAESRSALDKLVEEQAALGRVATLVARGGGADEVFSAVSNEVGRLFGSDQAAVARFEPDGSGMVVVGATAGIRGVSVGTRWGLEDFLASTAVYRTGRPARNDHTGHHAAAGPVADSLRQMDVVSTVAAPIVVETRLWGVMTVSDVDKPLPADAEQRLGKFTELVATAIGNSQALEHLAGLAAEQDALRRVATLVARESSRLEIVEAITNEAMQVVGTTIGLLRFETDSTATLVAQSDTPWPPPPLGTRFRLDGENVVTALYRTGELARLDDWTNATGDVSAMAEVLGVRSSVAAPIVVEGQLWGSMVGTTNRPEPLPPDTEARLLNFAELAATAIANAESRAELAASEARAHRLATEQAALRRVATLVAEGASADEVFSVVAEEIEAVLDITVVTICRCEPDGFLVLRSNGMPGFPVGSRWPWDVPSLPRQIYRTGCAARIDDFTDAVGLNEAARDAGIRAAVGVPIVVNGNVWGSICAATTKNEPLPLDAEDRLGRFRQLVATSISNTIMREELAASRARVIAAADDARRRIERDLHDGAQQRLVTLAVALRRAEAKIPAGLDAVQVEIARVTDGLATAVEELQELSRGIHPSILTEGGLSPALKALGRRSAVRVKLDMGFSRRLPNQVEVAAYYTVSEALTNAAKHATATRVWVSLHAPHHVLLLSIRDDGVGGADAGRGSGLTGLQDRIEALGGQFQITSPGGRGTRIDVQIPVGEALKPDAEADVAPAPMATAGSRRQSGL